MAWNTVSGPRRLSVGRLPVELALPQIDLGTKLEQPLPATSGRHDVFLLSGECDRRRWGAYRAAAITSDSAVSSAPQAWQKRAPARLSRPQALHSTPASVCRGARSEQVTRKTTWCSLVDVRHAGLLSDGEEWIGRG